MDGLGDHDDLVAEDNGTTYSPRLGQYSRPASPDWGRERGGLERDGGRLLMG